MADIDFDKIDETIANAKNEFGKIVETAGKVTDQLKNKVISDIPYYKAKIRNSQLYSKVGSKAGTIFQQIVGYGILTAGVSFLGMNPLSLENFHVLSIFPVIGEIVLAILGGTVGLSGTFRMFRLKRFQQYKNLLGEKTVVNMKELSEKTGKSVHFLQGDIKSMCEKGFFLQGHFSDDQMVFMASDAAFEEYNNWKKRQAEMIQNKEELKKAGLTKEGEELLIQGREYIESIHGIQEALSEKEIGKKLVRLEALLNRILQEVEKQPTSAMELRKLMNYYLPTTLKLLNTYCEIEKEPVKTEKMKITEKEIDEMIDTVNQAFEKKIDDLFLRKAWDVSSDISVMNTMLAQEGLKEGQQRINKENGNG